MKRLFLCLALLLSLAACGAEPKWADDAAVSRAAYVHEGPASITLFTVLNNRSGSGAHSGLMINGSQRVMFDPAGTWHHPYLPERNDVHYGMTDKMVAFYIDYHARVTYRVVQQTVYVTPAQAEIALQRAKGYGAVPKAMCARSVSSILRGVPGFEFDPVDIRSRQTDERLWRTSRVSRPRSSPTATPTTIMACCWFRPKTPRRADKRLHAGFRWTRSGRAHSNRLWAGRGLACGFSA